MPDIASGPLIPAPQYIEVSDADDYFATRLDADAWTSSSPDRKKAALVTATRAIDNLNFVGVKADDAQPLEFPRKAPQVSVNGAAFAPQYATTVPAEILLACCEEALARLDGVDPELEAANIRVAGTQYATVREQYSTAFVNEAARAGVVSQAAWNFLVPWLADPLSLYIARVQ